jgi:hypothetical protein
MLAPALRCDSVEMSHGDPNSDVSQVLFREILFAETLLRQGLGKVIECWFDLRLRPGDAPRGGDLGAVRQARSGSILPSATSLTGNLAPPAVSSTPTPFGVDNTDLQISEFDRSARGACQPAGDDAACSDYRPDDVDTHTGMWSLLRMNLAVGSRGIVVEGRPLGDTRDIAGNLTPPAGAGRPPSSPRIVAPARYVTGKDGNDDAILFTGDQAAYPKTASIPPRTAPRAIGPPGEDPMNFPAKPLG